MVHLANMTEHELRMPPTHAAVIPPCLDCRPAGCAANRNGTSEQQTAASQEAMAGRTSEVCRRKRTRQPTSATISTLMYT